MIFTAKNGILLVRFPHPVLRYSRFRSVPLKKRANAGTAFIFWKQFNFMLSVDVVLIVFVNMSSFLEMENGTENERIYKNGRGDLENS